MRRALVLCSVAVLGFVTLPVRGELKPIPFRSGPQALPVMSTGQVISSIEAIAPKAGSHFLIQFERGIKRSEREQLASIGVRLLDYVGANCYFATRTNPALDQSRLSSILKLGAVAAIQREHRLHPQLLAGSIPLYAIVNQARPAVDKSDTIVVLYLILQSDLAVDTDGTLLCRDHEAAILRYIPRIHGLVIEAKSSSIEKLAADDRVQWLEPAISRLEPAGNCDVSSILSDTGANIVQDSPYGLSGDGVDVMVYDAGAVDASAPDINASGRVTVEDSGGPDPGHATSVANIIASTGEHIPKGLAPGVSSILSYSRSNSGATEPGDLPDDFADAMSHGADLANASLQLTIPGNCPLRGAYTALDEAIDAVVFGGELAPFRVIWAAGNSAGEGANCCYSSGCNSPTCDAYPYCVQSSYMTVMPSANAKNEITVNWGNCDYPCYSGVTTAGGSFGPTADGRMKPDVVAFTRGQICTYPGDGYSCGTCCGYSLKVFGQTSAATPVVTGICALILEDYRSQSLGTSDPRNATLKALLSHSAIDIENPGPDYKSGYGSVRADSAIELLRSKNLNEQTVEEEDDEIDFTVIVPDYAPSFKITLAWDDPPGVLNCTQALINDLDLVVLEPLPSTTRHYPWKLGGVAHPDYDAIQDENHEDNIEQVVVDSPSGGAWRVGVKATSLPQGPQPFTIVASTSLCPSYNLLITQQPSSVSVIPHNNTSFSVTACNDQTLSYQWRKNGSNISNGTHYSGVTTATLSVNNVTSGQTGTYTVAITNARETKISDGAALTLDAGGQ